MSSTCMAYAARKVFAAVRRGYGHAFSHGRWVLVKQHATAQLHAQRRACKAGAHPDVVHNVAAQAPSWLCRMPASATAVASRRISWQRYMPTSGRRVALREQTDSRHFCSCGMMDDRGVLCSTAEPPTLCRTEDRWGASNEPKLCRSSVANQLEIQSPDRGGCCSLLCAAVDDKIQTEHTRHAAAAMRAAV